MQRGGFRVAGEDADFGWMAGGRTSRITADVALTGSAVNYHTFSVVAGKTYAVRSVSFVDITTIGTLWVGLGPASGSSNLHWLAAMFRASSAGAAVLTNGSGTTLTQLNASIANTGVMQIVMDGYFDANIDGNCRITHAVTASAVGTLKAGSFATIHRLS